MSMFARERAADLWPEIEPLLERHWREIATYADIPLAPDRERYNAMDAAGALRCYTARVREKDGLAAGSGATAARLVGYAIFSVAMNMHYRTSAIAVQDVLFVLPEYRGRAGLGLIRHAERELRAEGVKLIYHHQKVATPALGCLLKALGYEHLENIWGKRLDKGA